MGQGQVGIFSLVVFDEGGESYLFDVFFHWSLPRKLPEEISRSCSWPWGRLKTLPLPFTLLLFLPVLGCLLLCLVRLGAFLKCGAFASQCVCQGPVISGVLCPGQPLGLWHRASPHLCRPQPLLELAVTTAHSLAGAPEFWP